MASSAAPAVARRRPRAAGRRGLHPAAWWLWAGCLAVAAFRTTNPLLLVLIGAVAAYVVSHDQFHRRDNIVLGDIAHTVARQN